MVSERIPEDVDAIRVKVDGTGECFVYEGDQQYHYNGTNHPAFGPGCKHVWKTCGVFEGNKTHTLLSTLDKECAVKDVDSDDPAISRDGSKVCYYTEDISDNIAIAVVNTESMVASYIGVDLNDDGRKSNFCDLSPDGSAITFQSTRNLVPGADLSTSKYQVYVSYDNGATFSLPAGLAVANSQQYSMSGSYPQLSNLGNYLTFQAKIPHADITADLKTNELFLYKKQGDMLAKLTDHNNNYCNLTDTWEFMKGYWGEANLTAEGLTKASNTNCNLVATLGGYAEKKNSYAADLLGAGHGPARMSDNGRFIAYTSGFDLANIRGTHEKRQFITAANLFLYDTHLGMIWQITKEGDALRDDGTVATTEFQAKAADFCCASASSSYQPGTCSKKREYGGYCCWQRPCWFPAQWPDISGDGSSIAFFTAFNHTSATETPKDYEINHYHIPSGQMTIVTNTTDSDYDDTYPSISYTGEVIAFESDYDHENDEEIIKNNQPFAAKLTYGCPDATADNYVADPDVTVCKYSAEEGEPTMYGAKLRLKGGLNNKFYKIPFFKEADKLWKRKQLIRRFCNTYHQEVLNGLEIGLGVSRNALIKDPNFIKNCNKGNFNKKAVKYVVKFTDTIDGPSALTALQAAYDDTESALWKAYITKTIVGVELLEP